jgi:hypothetical protein
MAGLVASSVTSKMTSAFCLINEIVSIIVKLYIASQEEVEILVKLCVKHNVAVIPYGDTFISFSSF